MALLLLVVFAAAAWIGVDGQHARADLKSAATQVRVLQAQVARGDRKAGAATLRSLQKHAAAARAHTHGPQWSAGRAVPWLGPNIHAVQTVSEVIDDLSLKAMPALLNATSLVDPSTLAPVQGHVDLAPLVKAAPAVELANAQVQTGLRRLDAVGRYGLVGPVSAPLADLRTRVGTLALTTATAARAVRLLPPMLGSNGPREYLLLVQNNAEPRATGGIPGAVVRLSADHGAVKVVEQRSGNSLKAPTPVLPLTPSCASSIRRRAGHSPLESPDRRVSASRPSSPRSSATCAASGSRSACSRSTRAPCLRCWVRQGPLRCRPVSC